MMKRFESTVSPTRPRVASASRAFVVAVLVVAFLSGCLTYRVKAAAPSIDGYALVGAGELAGAVALAFIPVGDITKEDGGTLSYPARFALFTGVIVFVDAVIALALYRRRTK